MKTNKKTKKYKVVMEVSVPISVAMVPASSSWLTKLQMNSRQDEKKKEKRHKKAKEQREEAKILQGGDIAATIANHSGLATDWSRNIPVEAASVGQSLPEGNQGGLVVCTGRSTKKEKKDE